MGTPLLNKRSITLSLIIIMISFVTTSFAASPADKLYKRLEKIQEKGYMFGHQDDPFYGITWRWDNNRSDVLELVGEYPAVMGFELGGIEMADAKNLDSVPFQRIHDEIINQYNRGGIITISWHPRNPLTGGTAWDVTSDKVVKSILPDGENNKKFQLWMQRIGDFLVSLKTEKGKNIPVIFRPWHENNGSWFWWGQKLCTDEEYKGLWNMLQDYLNSRGLNNLLYSYSPNLDGNWTEERYNKRYPGDDRVKLLGEDAYQWGAEADYISQVSKDLDFLTSFTKKHNKLMALTECGYQNIPDKTWWTGVLEKITDKYPICYFLLWRNDAKGYFAPNITDHSADDFMKLYHAKKTLFLNEIKIIK